jgi:hypothetical protein
MICTESGGAYYTEQTKGGFRGAGLKTGEEEKIYARVPFLMVFRDGRAHRKVRIPPILTLLTRSFSGSLELRRLFSGLSSLRREISSLYHVTKQSTLH